MRFTFLTLGALAAGLTLGSLLGPMPRATARAGWNLVRNGAFDQDKTAWAANFTGTHVGGDYGRDGPGMQLWPEFDNNVGYIYQELYLPTRTTAARLSFDYRFVPGSGGALGYFRARLTTSAGALAMPLDVSVYPGQNWQRVDVALGAEELAALNAAHSAGQPVYLLVELYAQFLYVNVDNVAFQVSGQMDFPPLEGSIAYIGLDAGGYARTVNRMGPKGEEQRTLWTHPGTAPEINAIADVAWKPDASELAFSSNHESAYSAFNSDVYGIQPDGSGLRRISNPPSQAELSAGGYQFGSVTGRIYNNYGYVAAFFVYVEGALDLVRVDVGEYGDEVSFTVPDVADLGTGLHYVVFIWSKLNCANGREYAAAVVDVAPGQTADAGTLTFEGNCGEYLGTNISWRGDGAQLAVDVITPRIFQATGEAIGRELFDAPLTAEKAAWSPVDDRILYHNQTFDNTTSGLYLTTVGGGAGRPLVADGGALWVSAAWLPDGFGFVYSLDNALYQYDLASGQSRPLAQFFNEYVAHPSLSPDGKYVVFERQSTGLPLRYDLWIVNRANPTEMWPLTDDGRSANPDWSRVTPPKKPAVPTPAPTAQPTRPPPPTPAPTSEAQSGLDDSAGPGATARPTAGATSTPRAAVTPAPTGTAPAERGGGGLCPLGAVLPLALGLTAAFWQFRPNKRRKNIHEQANARPGESAGPHPGPGRLRRRGTDADSPERHPDPGRCGRHSCHPAAGIERTDLAAAD